ncbi:ABC transporter permease [Mesorhizobium sp. CU2]|uniref:ABC transporter permease n=1 Tax=unclassified Mesorhizobium TaxID=325217 RepID=UPI00112B11EF|nr:MULTISPECIES: ABC transporter permease [unclassified Mesorhizobium]TPN81120.1 ABC transporter permease [Mesorhizobium sp. CU3]TPO17082.1 ABC transporter permease [Mesorhizobium sp. CU2]
MRKPTFTKTLSNGFLGLCIAYMVLPLIIMGGAGFNDSRFPSVYPWHGFTARWFVDLWNDQPMLDAGINTFFLALVVVAISVPTGTAAALLLNSWQSKARPVLFGILIAPILTPGVVVGISTLLFWKEFNISAGLHLSALGQVSYIATYVMLLVLARLQSFDKGLEEAALDLGASHGQVMRRIVLPHLYPAIVLGAVLAFFQSVENYNITLFTRGSAQTLTVYIGSMVRTGFTPEINALGLLFILITVAGVIYVELRRRRHERRELKLEALAAIEEDKDLQGIAA